MVKVKTYVGLALLNLMPVVSYAVTPADAIDAGYGAGNVDWGSVTANRAIPKP